MEYESGGIPEYWLIDPERQQAEYRVQFAVQDGEPFRLLNVILDRQLGQIGALTIRTGDPARDFAEYEAALAASTPDSGVDSAYVELKRDALERATPEAGPAAPAAEAAAQ